MNDTPETQPAPETPRTDAILNRDHGHPMLAELALTEHARSLERDLLAVTAQRDAYKERLCISPQGDDEIDALQSAMNLLRGRVADVERERDEARATLAAAIGERDAAREELAAANFRLGEVSIIESGMRQADEAERLAAIEERDDPEGAAIKKQQFDALWLRIVNPAAQAEIDTLRSSLASAVAAKEKAESHIRDIKCQWKLGGRVMQWLIDSRAYEGGPKGELGEEALFRVLGTVMPLRAALRPFINLGKPSDDRPAFHDLPNDYTLFENSGDTITVGDIRVIQDAAMSTPEAAP